MAGDDGREWVENLGHMLKLLLYRGNLRCLGGERLEFVL